MNLYLGVVISALLLAGCSTAGPFVTNISSDGAGGVTVEKCMIHYNPMGWVNNSDCTSTNLHLSNTQSK